METIKSRNDNFIGIVENDNEAHSYRIHAIKATLSVADPLAVERGMGGIKLASHTLLAMLDELEDEYEELHNA